MNKMLVKFKTVGTAVCAAVLSGFLLLSCQMIGLGEEVGIYDEDYIKSIIEDSESCLSDYQRSRAEQSRSLSRSISEYDAISEALSDVEAKLKDEGFSLEEKVYFIEAMDKLLSEHKDTVAQRESYLKKLESQIASLTEQKGILEKQYDYLSDKQSWMTQNPNLAAEFNTLGASLSIINEEIDNLTVEKASLYAEIEKENSFLLLELRVLSEYKQQLKEDVSSESSRAEGLKAESNRIIIKALNVILEALDNGTPVTSDILEDLKDYDDILDKINDKITEYSKIKEAYELLLSISAKEKELAAANDSRNKTEIARLEKELAQAKDELSAKDEMYRNLEEVNTELIDLNKILQESIAAGSDEISSFKLMLKEAESRYTDLSNKYDELLAERNKLAESYDSLAEAKKQLESAKAESDSNVTALTAKVSSLEKEIEVLNTAVNAKQKEYDRLAEELSGTRKELEAAVTDLEDAKAEIEKLKNQIKSQSETVSTLQSERDRLVKELAAATATLESVQNAKQEKEDALDVAEDNLAKAEQALEQARQNQATTEAELEELQRAYDEAVVARDNAEAEKDAAAKDYEEKQKELEEGNTAYAKTVKELTEANASLQTAYEAMKALVAFTWDIGIATGSLENKYYEGQILWGFYTAKLYTKYELYSDSKSLSFNLYNYESSGWFGEGVKNISTKASETLYAVEQLDNGIYVAFNASSDTFVVLRNKNGSVQIMQKSDVTDIAGLNLKLYSSMKEAEEDYHNNGKNRKWIDLVTLYENYAKSMKGKSTL